MQNKLSDLNNHLFAQLERLGDETLTAEQLSIELERARAIAGVSNQIIATAKLVLDAEVARSEHNLKITPLALAAG